MARTLLMKREFIGSKYFIPARLPIFNWRIGFFIFFLKVLIEFVKKNSS